MKLRRSLGLMNLGGDLAHGTSIASALRHVIAGGQRLHNRVQHSRLDFGKLHRG